MKRYLWAIVLGVFIASFVGSAISQDVLASSYAQLHKEAGAPGLMGAVKSSDGKPLRGIAVSAQASNLTFKTTVFTDDQGQFVFPKLAAGDYRLWAQAVGFNTEQATVKLDGVQTAHQDFVLKMLTNFEAQLSGAEWFAALPEDTKSHRRMKQVLYVACSGCHGLDVVLNNKFDEAGWTETVKAMESATYNGYRGKEDYPVNQLSWEGQIIRHHRDELAKYLAEVRGPGRSPMVLKPMSRPEGEAARIVVTQYDLPIAERGNEMSWYNGDDWMKGAATGMHGMVGVHDVLADANGNAWITQAQTTFETNRSLIRLKPETGEMTAYKVTNSEGRPMYFEQIVLSPEGLIWMHDGQDVVRLNPSTASFYSYQVPVAFGGAQNSIDADKAGRVWINGKYGTLELDPSAMNQPDVLYPGWHLYRQLTVGNSVTYGVAADADNNPWWSESFSDKVATKNMKTGKVTEFDMHDPEYESRKALATPEDLSFYDSIGALTWGTDSADPVPYSELPLGLSADKNGETVWIPNWAASNVAEINTHTYKVTYHELPIKVHPYNTVVDKNHNVYVDTQVGNGMYKFVPSTQKWTYFQLPTHGCNPSQMSFDDYRGEAWVPCDQADAVDRIQFRSAEQVRALEAAGTTASR